MEIFIFASIFLGLDILFNILSSRVFKFLGIDLLFFASWITGINYGIKEGLFLSFILVLEHSILHLNKSRLIVLSIPSQISAVLLGYFLGPTHFLTSLLIYQLINTLIMLLVGGFGPFFVLFLISNTLFNILTQKIWIQIFGF